MLGAVASAAARGARRGDARVAMRAGGALVDVQQRGMAENLKDIQLRITSTKNVQKITKSMKMVSAAKLRGDTERLEKGRPFGNSMNKLFNAEPGEEDTPLEPAKAPVYVIISTDRGLCGGVNSFVAKATKAALEVDVAAGLSPKVFVVGDKGHAQLARSFPKSLIGQVNEPWKTPMNMDKALTIADHIIRAAGPEMDQVNIVYNKFVSAIRSDTEIKKVPNFATRSAGDDESSAELPFPLYKYEGELESTEEAMINLFEYGLAVELYGCLIENATSEQSARMSAMDGASKNAGEMVDKLTVRYNRARQAKITTELIEIISGAESLEG